MHGHRFMDDPNYHCEPASFLREAVEGLTNYQVVSDPHMADRVLEIDDRAREIRVRPGEPFRRFHELVGRATLYVVGGSAWAPEFRTRPKLTVVQELPRQRGE